METINLICFREITFFKFIDVYTTVFSVQEIRVYDNGKFALVDIYIVTGAILSHETYMYAFIS